MNNTGAKLHERRLNWLWCLGHLDNYPVLCFELSELLGIIWRNKNYWSHVLCLATDRIPMHGTFNNLKNWYYKVIWKLAWFWLIVCLVIFCETWPNKTFNDPVLKFCCLFVNFDEIFSRIQRSLQLVQEVGQCRNNSVENTERVANQNIINYTLIREHR